MKKTGGIAFALIATAILATSAAAADRTQAVRFKAGATSATLTGSIKGYDTISYTLGASAGQVMSVLFSPRNGACYFNLMPPRSNEAIFIGSTTGNEFAGTLGVGGKYTIQIYLMRSAARRNETCKYDLTVEIAGGGGGASDATANMPSQDEQVCLQAVTQQTNNGDVVLLGTETSEANNAVMVGVGPDRAPWRCLVKNGIVAEVMSMTDEGGL